jgi:hypothetical protein
MVYPQTEVTMRTVTANVNQSWVDNKKTEDVETLTDIVNESFITNY